MMLRAARLIVNGHLAERPGNGFLACFSPRAQARGVLICPICERMYPPGEFERCPDDDSLLYAFGSMTETERKRLQIGDIVAGKYELLGEIERRGGAGRTFKAFQQNLQRNVELRVLPPGTITQPSDHARFQREVATWGRLRSDHLVRLYDSGFTADNAPYMALEFVDDGSLGVVVEREGPLSFEAARIVAEHILEALDTAHENQVLHRDISPDALVLTTHEDGTMNCRLTGFGLAKHMGDDEDDPTAITMTGQVIGNPAYMAPETIMAGTLDPRTDLYALGVTLYELITAERPFPGTSLASLLKAHVQGHQVPILERRADTPEDLAAFVTKLLTTDPMRRYQTASAALDALGSGIADWPEAPVLPASIVDRATDRPVSGQQTGGPSRKIVVLALVAAAAVVGAAVLLLR